MLVGQLKRFLNQFCDDQEVRIATEINHINVERRDCKCQN